MPDLATKFALDNANIYADGDILMALNSLIAW